MIQKYNNSFIGLKKLQKAGAGKKEFPLSTAKKIYG